MVLTFFQDLFLHLGSFLRSGLWLGWVLCINFRFSLGDSQGNLRKYRTRSPRKKILFVTMFEV